ncbi:hypothetical protein JE952_002416 [Flavobacterium psychrophilum]|uniref:hypothetical protein n=1 Tax=Flavobacterium psychrophilum TaxID=96345 RepID=UPI0006187583|nr:hypothetical protein [Flavobacterium psychrophilum]EKT4550760.1 hypothetical protein [Flavobacterium psychrophilum]ELM3645258.1 hypothetical protein [Flavobacterium psychrophilum]MCB6062687.1 hypothetical protein [Flavobacterium psychrophilum]MCB6089347.1 hypothetical protein [Flavobacterium psychrophilum]OAE90516.1 hypothetical protein SU65_12325 [Flavobacterium psychrophilum]
MAAGGPGDHPITDIINFNLKVYNKECDELIKEISKLVSMNQLYEMFDWFDNFSATKSKLKNFEIELNKKLEKLKANAKDKGWET